ncbi:MAG TPA: phage portal protein [Verrucomicrobiae bacterium]|nr:phage portal protein [Verrucomicrobiae bacterium]
MSLADRALSWLGLSRLRDPVKADTTSVDDTAPLPGNVPEPGPRNINSGTMNYYEALSTSDDRSQIPLYSLAIRTAIQSFNRDRLAFLGRYLYDNDGTVGYAVDQIANYSAPIIPMACTKNAVTNKIYEDYFDDWCKRADYTGRFHFGMLQRIICKQVDTDGDVLATVNDKHGFPQVQLIEGWRVNSRLVANDNITHVDGVRVDLEGVVLGYYMVDAANVIGSTLIGTKAPSYLDAAQAFLLYDPDRFSSYRGITPIRRGMNDVRDAKDIKGFEKLATKIGAALAAVIEGADVLEEDVWENDTGNDSQPGNAPPADATQQELKLSKAQLLGGDIPVLANGQKLNQLKNDRPGALVMELLDYLGGCFVSGLGVPPGFFLDKRFTGPTQRGINGKAQRKFDKRQEMLAHFVEWVWVRVIGWGIANDGLPSEPGWNKIEWQGPPKVSIDDGDDAASWREDVASGLMSRREHYANRSLNWQREVDQGFIEDDYIITKANQLAKKQNVPVTVILSRWGYQQQTKPAPNPSEPNQESPNDSDKQENQ